MAYAGQYTVIEASEQDVFSMDFATDLAAASGDSIQSATVTLQVENGTDASSHLPVGPVVVGTVVSQKVINLTAGLAYRIIFKVTTVQGRQLTLWGDVYCSAPAL